MAAALPGVVAHLHHLDRRQGRPMVLRMEQSMSIILIIVLLIILLGGGGWYGYGRWGNNGLGGVIGLVLIILLILFLTGHLHG
jgi:hypothetical protein